MSFQAMTWAVAQKCGAASTKLVLLMLANHANGHTGQCNPRHKLLAEECDMTVDTLKTQLKKLEAMGLIEIIPQYADGVQLPNHYRLNLGGGGGKNYPGGGGDFSGEGGGKIYPPYNQEVNQEVKPITPIPPKGGSSVSFKTWLQTVKEKGEKPIPEDDAVFAYAEQVGIPTDFLSLAWSEMKARYSDPHSKRYKDWRRVFRTAVRANWFKLWYFDTASNTYALTTQGQQAQRA